MAKKTKTKAAKRSYNSHVIAIDYESSYGTDTSMFSSVADLTKQILEGEYIPSSKSRFFMVGPELHYEMSFEQIPVTRTKATLKVVNSK